MSDLLCPRCLEKAAVRLDVATGKTLTCGGCDEEFTVAQVEALVAGWAAVLPRLRGFGEAVA